MAQEALGDLPEDSTNVQPEKEIARLPSDTFWGDGQLAADRVKGCAGERDLRGMQVSA
jgi:hypothetical protein